MTASSEELDSGRSDGSGNGGGATFGQARRDGYGHRQATQGGGEGGAELTGWLSKAGDSLVAADRRRRRRRSAATEEEDDGEPALPCSSAPCGCSRGRSRPRGSSQARSDDEGRPVATAVPKRGDGGARVPWIWGRGGEANEGRE
jgi:hypothetical protein